MADAITWVWPFGIHEVAQSWDQPFDGREQFPGFLNSDVVSFSRVRIYHFCVDGLFPRLACRFGLFKRHILKHLVYHRLETKKTVHALILGLGLIFLNEMFKGQEAGLQIVFDDVRISGL
jgi:hypothetical protein